jgi:hypothetical protein
MPLRSGQWSLQLLLFIATMASIERRVSQDGSVTFRVKVRTKGHPPVTASFRRKTDAVKYATTVQADIIAGRYQWEVEAKRHTFNDLCDEYIKQILPLQAKSADKKRLHICPNHDLI